jgi:single-stranded-DNA-specific exonuclease
VKAAVDAGLLLKGGGHAMAAGLTVAEDGLAALRDFLDARLTTDISSAREVNSLPVDAAVTAGGLTIELATDIARAGPFGQGNPEPLLALPSHVLVDVSPVGTAHMRVRFRASDGTSAQGIAFRSQGQPLGEALLANRGKTVHLLGSLQVDRWGGRERVDLRIVDLAQVN